MTETGTSVCITFVLIAVIAFIAVLVIHDNKYRVAQHTMITELVKAGADPVTAACAITGKQCYIGPKR